MPSVALLSNPSSTGNRSILPRVRSFCADHPEVFHYEVESVDQIGVALRTIARVKPKVLIINGGDGTVQTTLTELYLGDYFDGAPPPVAVLPNGKTNLIALDLGARGDPIAMLETVVQMASGDLAEHIVRRELISLSDGEAATRPVLGMFLGGAGLADTILYCRHKVYPLGLPNGFSHVLTTLALLLTMFFGIRAAFLPPRARAVNVSVLRQGEIAGKFSIMIVTTLEKLLLNTATKMPGTTKTGALQLMMVDQSPWALIRAIFAGIGGKLGARQMNGVHIERGDEIRIEGDRSSVILDGEIFHSYTGRPIVLTPTAPIPFLRMAA